VTWERRHLGLGTASAIVVANMIGAGVFTTSGFALADLGSAPRVLAAWALGGAIGLCGALSYGGIAQRIPISGGEATYLGRAVHPVLGFMAGWVSILAGFTGPIAAAALAIGPYAGTAAGLTLSSGVVGSVVILAAAWLHAMRPDVGTSSLNLLVVCKGIALAAFCIWGAWAIAGSPAPAAPAAPGPFDVGAFAVTLVWVSFSYSGWNGAIYLASEIRDPERNLRRALWMPTLGVSLVYLALNAVFLAGPPETLVGRPDIGAAAAEALGGVVAARVVAALVVIALVTSISVMVLSGSRVLARLARDGMLPAALGEGGIAPRAAIAFQALLCIAIVWLSDLAQLIATLGFTLGLSAATTVVVAGWLRHREGAELVPIPGYPVVPLLFVVFTVGSSGFLVWRNPADAALGTAMLLAGLPAYLLAKRMGRARAAP
jgi:APA family basic amino acid/polyamine antiporter